MASNNVSVSNGVNNFATSNLVGQTVENLTGGPFADVLQLNGDEVVTVSSNGGDYRTVDSFYTFQAGDSVRFARSGGDKGSR